ncbi:arylesterase [Comamonas faecalis]|uniref:Arylesterase n=1 Tax=Comamonas faecalis TaxID=1387849 RepID=A0ABP7RPW3_9BURK
MHIWRRRDCIAAAALALAYPLARAAAAAKPATILVVGDSMSAEYGLPRGSGWVQLLHERLEREAPQATLVNASISGDTTSGGRARLPALLARHKPTLVVLELGGNDALRGLPLKSTEDNLTAMAQACRAAGAQVLLVGMQVPPNYGADYARRFAALFKEVAQAQGAALVPFLLAGVADAADPTALFQPDRIHPSIQAQPRMLDNVWPHLAPLLR